MSKRPRRHGRSLDLLPPTVVDPFPNILINSETKSTIVKSQTKAWSFNTTNRLHALLSSSSMSSLGVKPLSPPRRKKKRSSLLATEEHGKGDHTDVQKSVLFDLSGNDLSRKSLYFPFAPTSPKSLNRFKKRSKQGDGRRSSIVGFNYFGILPDEMILRVLKQLPKESLGRIAQVNKRFSRLVEDESLWEKIDCIGLTISSAQTAVICQRNPHYLRFSRATILDDGPNSLYLTNIQYLDLTMAIISPETLSALLIRCNSLIKLSLEHVSVSNQVVGAMRGCQSSIETLNLCMAYGLEAECFAEWLRGCKSLTQLNLGCISQKWTEKELMTVIGAIPVSLEQLNLSGFRYVLKDAHSHLLSVRLVKLLDLDLSDSQELTGRTLEYMTNLRLLQHLSLSRCYSIEPQSYALLGGIKTLRFLELFSLFKESSIKNLASNLKGIEINQFPFSAIARPTVGNRRSSIWGKRIRD